MTTLVDELSQKALELPPEERVRLAERLLATVHVVEADVDAAGDEEIKRRLADIENGSARLIPAEEVFAEVRRILK
jgi:putative addiction module component (TIGR02574 family)